MPHVQPISSCLFDHRLKIFDEEHTLQTYYYVIFSKLFLFTFYWIRFSREHFVLELH